MSDLKAAQNFPNISSATQAINEFILNQVVLPYL